MTKQHYKITINATAEKIWDVLWGATNYPKWTSVFDPGSHAVTDWVEGSKALFLGAEGNGMVSRIVEHKPNEYMLFEHLGEIKDGVEDLESPQAKQWAGALEDYTLVAGKGNCELTTSIDIADDYAKWFEDIWPKALEIVKTMAEQE